MARTALRVRPAEVADLPALLAFGDELRDQLLPSEVGARPRGVPAMARAYLEQRYVEALEDADRHLVVVVGEDDEPLGMALFTVASANALLDLPAVHMSHAVVADRHKRRGAGKALVGAAASFAEQRGLEQIVVSVHPGSRDANRFFARLGFAPLAVRRVAPVAMVRRRLAQGDHRPADHVVRRRPRRLGRPANPAPVPLGPADDDTWDVAPGS
ncbi:MAG: GCN5-related N-acetyltransferase [Frankiales bacterium]|nr:GCN5-related N-acetyltransferase [Frankiales bacterium]